MPWATLFLSLFNTKKAFHHWKIPHSVLPQSNLYVRQSLFYSFNGCSKFYNYIRIYIESLRWIYYTNIILYHLYSLLKFLYSVHERFKLQRFTIYEETPHICIIILPGTYNRFWYCKVDGRWCM